MTTQAQFRWRRIQHSEVNMKQLAILITAIITLMMWPLDWLREQRPLPIVYDATAARLTAIAPQPTSVKAAHPLVYDATGAMLATINPQATEKTASLPIAYDATGAMLAALNPGVVGQAASLPIVYDATGAMQAALNPGVVGQAASLPIVYDATGAMLAALNPGVVGKAASLPIVYDATGAMQAALTLYKAEERSAGQSPVSAPQSVNPPTSGYMLYLGLTLAAAALAAGGWYLRRRVGHTR